MLPRLSARKLATIIIRLDHGNLFWAQYCCIQCMQQYTLNTFLNLFILKKGGLNAGEHGGRCDIRSHKRGCCCIHIWTSGRISTGGTCFLTANHLLMGHFLLLVIVMGKKIEEMMPPVNDAEECKMSQLNIISESGFC